MAKRETPQQERDRKEREQIRKHNPALNKNKGGGGRKTKDGR